MFSVFAKKSIMRFNKPGLNFNPFVVGIGLLAIPVFALFLSSLLFVCGLSINLGVFPLSIILAGAVMYLACEKKRVDFWTSVICVLLLIAGTLAMATFFYDYSYDGQAYHQEIIFKLKNGWNPIYETHPESVFATLLAHYAKGLETVSATIYSTFGNIESGKAVNLMLILASAFLFFAFLKTCFEKLTQNKQLFLTFLFAFSPIVVAQSLTYYIDGAAYSLMLILIPTLILFFKKQSPYHLFIIGCVLLFAGTIKFNLSFWIAFAVGLYLVYALVIRRCDLFRKLLITGVCCGFCSVFLLAFNPYISNTRDHKNPMYPLAGEGKIDILDGQIPPELLEKSRFESVLISLFSFHNNAPHSNDKREWALPTKIRKRQFYEYITVDLRIGGFGMFFSWVLVLSTIVYALVISRKNKNESINYHLFLGLLFISLFILPYAWWARYFPYFYAFPLIMLLYSEREKQSRGVVLLRNSAYLLLLLNISLFCGAVLLRSQMHKTALHQAMDVFAKSKEPAQINFDCNFALKLKLDDQKIPYKETFEKLGTVIWDIGPAIYLNSEKYIQKDKQIIEVQP